MIDIKKLQKRADKILAKETSKSLRRWYSKYRSKNYKNKELVARFFNLKQSQ